MAGLHHHLLVTFLWTALTFLYLTPAVSSCGRWFPIPEHSNMRVDHTGFLSTPLDDYVRTPDEHYKYDYLSEVQRPGYTIHFLNMTSQKWLNENIVVNPIWWHIVIIIVPDTITHPNAGFLWIDGRTNTQSIPDPDDYLIITSAVSAVGSGTVATILLQVPNQPIVFKNDPSATSRTEDAIVAWTWHLYLAHGFDPQILARLPMTKAAVRAMDTTTTFVQNVTGNTLQHFMVAGTSKRGYTAWTTAAVDSRVVAVAPVVMDMLGIQDTLHHMYRSLGGWTYAFYDYYVLNITEHIDSPRILSFENAIDPLAYKDRYTMPKLIISAAGDQFFLPDNSDFYYNQLPGRTYLRMIPNTDHSLFGHFEAATSSLLTFWLLVLNAEPGHPSHAEALGVLLPAMTWTRETTETGRGRITLNLSRPPTDVTVYHTQTVTPGRRDFRKYVMSPEGYPVITDSMWTSSQPNQLDTLTYQAEMDPPSEGHYAAFFLKAKFQTVTGRALEITTQVSIIPDTLPFSQCTGAGCAGTLV